MFSSDESVIRNYLDAIKCQNRWLILGNHDEALALFEPGAFIECCHYKEIKVEGRMCCLSHYPMLDWNCGIVHHGIDRDLASYMLHGHIHSQSRGLNGDTARQGIWRYDVGVDANGYRPVSFEEIRDFIEARDSVVR